MQKKQTSTKAMKASLRPDPTDYEVVGELACTNTALRRAARRLGQLYDEALAVLDLKATQLSLIVEIDRLSNADRGPTLQELAARLAIQLSAITHALRPLVRDGLIELRHDPDDRRTKRGTLTPLGRETLRKALTLWDEANRRVERVLSPASAAALRSLADEVASEGFLVSYQAERQQAKAKPGRTVDAH
jgi:DNA-binding MarR family transcriptional regulator